MGVRCCEQGRATLKGDAGKGDVAPQTNCEINFSACLTVTGIEPGDINV
jgi:hypothetical protein